MQVSWADKETDVIDVTIKVCQFERWSVSNKDRFNILSFKQQLKNRTPMVFNCL